MNNQMKNWKSKEKDPFIVNSKILLSIKEALIRCELKNGMTISFHHHLRNGDYVLNMVIEEIARLGIKDITLISSSITLAHESLIEHIESGVISGLHTTGLRGELGKKILIDGIMEKPVIFRSHGGRARAIQTGELKIDISFIATSACDCCGNMNGIDGDSAFGSLGYAMVDAQYAKKVIAITDNLVSFPLERISISMDFVDFVIEVEKIGNPDKIATGSTRITTNPLDLLIAERAAEVLIASGVIKNNFSFQAGSGGPSLAVCKFLKDYMQENKIKGSFAAGGATSYLVQMLEEGLFKILFDTQTFDGEAVNSFKKNSNHIEMSASMYANPAAKSCTADLLDVMILSATEIDVNFNINSLTGTTGMFMGAIGGAQDTAAGAKITIVVVPTMRKRIPIILDKVTNICTPGRDIDILVTEKGISVNPIRKDLKERLKNSGIETMDIKELKKEIQYLTGIPRLPEYEEKVVGIIQYRDGSILDSIKKLKTKNISISN